MATEIEWPAGLLLTYSQEERTDWLTRQLTDLAEARSHATVVYAEAFLGGEGTDRIREQRARLAAAEAHLAAEKIAAQVRAFQFLFDNNTEEGNQT